MRQLLSAVTIAALVAFLPATRAPSQDAPAGVDVTPEGIFVHGWRRQAAPTGTVFFYCASSACRPDDVVSYRLQPDGPPVPLDEFRARQESANRNMVAQSQGRIARIDLAPPREERDAGGVIYTAVTTVVRADGSTSGQIAILVARGTRQLTLVSSSDTPDRALRNVERFRSAAVLFLTLRAMR